MERLLGAAKELSEKVDSNETAAGDLLRQCESLQEELKAMKQVRLKRKSNFNYWEKISSIMRQKRVTL